jgi:hypothetical protein
VNDLTVHLNDLALDGAPSDGDDDDDEGGYYPMLVTAD